MVWLYATLYCSLALVRFLILVVPCKVYGRPLRIKVNALKSMLWLPLVAGQSVAWVVVFYLVVMAWSYGKVLRR